MKILVTVNYGVSSTQGIFVSSRGSSFPPIVTLSNCHLNRVQIHPVVDDGTVNVADNVGLGGAMVCHARRGAH